MTSRLQLYTPHKLIHLRAKACGGSYLESEISRGPHGSVAWWPIRLVFELVQMTTLFSKEKKMILTKKQKKPRFAFLQGYGTDDHVDYYTVAIQSGGVIDGRKVLDHAFFWTKDHVDMDEFTDAIMQYFRKWKVKEVRYVPVIFPWTYCDKCNCGELTFMVYDYDDPGLFSISISKFKALMEGE